MAVYYATETGTAQRLAVDLRDLLSERYSVVLRNVSEFSFANGGTRMSNGSYRLTYPPCFS